MSFPSSHPSPPKRPRLSLQIKTPGAAQTLGKSSTALKSDINPTSPTAFNTLSNAYAAAIENSSPRTARPISALDLKTPTNPKPTSLRLETAFSGDNYVQPSQRTQTPGPFSITYPDTPSTDFPNSTPITAHPDLQKSGSSSFTYTPPQSAGSTEQPLPKIFTYPAQTSMRTTPNSPRTPRRRATIGHQYQSAPYTHPRSLHSILRNSPLPPPSAVAPVTPSRISMRLANRAAKRVGYNDPLTQTITTNKYVKSHIDLLSEDSPYSATEPESDKAESLDLAMAYTGDETRDGGQTPGPFEEMRRRMAESGLETPGTRKRKRKEKKRKWVWTIGVNGEETEESELVDGIPTTAVKIETTPATAIYRGPSVDPSTDSEMSEVDERPGTSHSL